MARTAPATASPDIAGDAAGAPPRAASRPSAEGARA